MYRISVIIPVYNAEPYMARCCKSLFGQTLDKIQYIFVNDGSKDDSVRIIKESLADFPNRSNDVLVINRDENKGVCITRQQGLDAAKGEFIIHCDADDWVESDAYEILYNFAIKENSEIVCSDYYVDYACTHTIISKMTDYNIKRNFNISPNIGSLVNKLIKRSIIIKYNIKFTEGINWGEDFLFSKKCQLLANKISVVHKPLYHYVQNKDSITHTIGFERCNELIQCGSDMEEFLYNNFMHGEYLYELNYLKFQIKSYLLIIPELYSPKSWIKIYPECHSDIMRYDIPLYLKLVTLAITHHMTPLATLAMKTREYVNNIRKK